MNKPIIFSALTAAKKAAYRDKLKSLFGASIISFLPLDELTGAPAADYGPNNYPGSYAGVTLNNSTGPDAKPVALFPGSNSAAINWYSAGLAAAFDGNAGGLMLWAKVQSAGVWADASYRRIAELGAGAQYIRISRQGGTAGRLYCEHKVISALVNIDTGSPTTWFNIFLSWSKANNQFIAYFNGSPVGAPQAIPNSFTNALVSTTTTIGAASTTFSNSWSGWLAYALLLNRIPTPAEVTAANVI